MGETLTADTSGIADEDGLVNATFSYQWIANDGGTDTDIADATGSSYALVSEDEGKRVKVRGLLHRRPGQRGIADQLGDGWGGVPPELTRQWSADNQRDRTVG